MDSDLGPAEGFGLLGGDLRTEICVVGAGMAGLSVAYHLARAGRQVVVVEAGPGPGMGETNRSTAHVTSAVDDGFIELSRLFGADGARLVAESHAAAVNSIEQIIADEGIACDFCRLDGWLFNPSSGAARDLEAEARAASRAGLDAAMKARAPLAGFDTGPAIRFAHQARLNPHAYMAGLAQAAARYGARLFGNAQAASVEGGHPARVSTAQGWHVLADAVVVATNVPINDLFAIHGKLAPMRTYAVALDVTGEADTDALYWDTLDPYHYARFGVAGDGARVLIVGGEDHRVGLPAHGDQRWARLEGWARARFAGLGPVRARWSGQIMEPADRIAFIGRNPMDANNVFVAAGDSGNGITHGAMAGLLITDLVLGRFNPWAKLYDPSRVTLKAAQSYADTNLHVAEHYAEWLTGGDVEDVAQIPPDSGAVLREGLTKVAVYRDLAGVVHKRSAVCSHLKCIVAWNDAERTWDCACHGSRFDRFGRVLNGPAGAPLPPVEE
ncbi:MAG: FAD-dependent oxidoreductase [Rhodospirillaceae bacterium]|nr:FAD-dependent oxidoreductase [Rhodospirillales bacterium]